MQTEEADVVIVGAGIAGLRTADLLRSSGKSVMVLEANERIGGRIVNQKIPDSELYVEGGAQFVGATHKRMLSLLKELDLDVFETYDTGKFRWAQEILGPLRFGLSPDTSEPSSFEKLRQQIERLATTVPTEAPWNSAEAKELDSQTFGEYLRKVEQKASVRVPYERLCRMHLGCDPDAVSLLYMLFLLHATFEKDRGGYKLFVQHDGGVHQYRVDGGTFSLCSKLADRVGRDSIRTNSPIQAILQQKDFVEVRGEGLNVLAKQVVITLQPQLCSKIKFTPELSGDRIALQDSYLTKKSMIAKTHMVYERPFWRDRGYKGTGVTSSGVVFVDNTPCGGEIGILLAFRDRSRRDLTHAKLLGYAATLFGAAARHPKHIIEQDWSAEPWSSSCISHTPPGILSKYGYTLRASVGRIHWAGAETSDAWPSFMEGALQSAERVVEELSQ